MEFENLLDELFTAELCFQIEEEEVNFIKTGIETLVQIIADLVWKNNYKTIEAETENILKKQPGLQISRDGKYTINDIVKAGSFYENTKNVYPDQFDYIFLMGVFESSSRNLADNEKDFVTKVSDLHNCFRDTLTTCDISFPALTERKRFIRFDRYIERKGPSSRLRFIYGHDNTERFIHADIVPAFKVLLHGNVDEIANKCEISGFKDEVKVSSSIILVQEHISFVETEVYFMRYVLSSKHVKAYRLLKYIMNGCYEENVQAKCACKAELLNALGNSKSKLVPSYHMKRVAISHHYECKKGNSGHVAQCLFQMMENIKHITFISSVKKLYELYIDRPLTLTGYRQELLDKTTKSFKELQTLLTKRITSETCISESLQGKLTLNYTNSQTYERNDRIDNLNEFEAQVGQPLQKNEGKVAEKLDKKEQKRLQKEHVKHKDNQHLKSNDEDKSDRKDITAHSFRIDSLNARASSVVPEENPLISNTGENDAFQERTKASHWFKTLSTYFTNLILIVICGIFVVLVLYVLSNRR